jgi:hypothetical protein
MQQVTKTVADKLLKEMEQNGVIMGKATKKDGGGQWVFWSLQVYLVSNILNSQG